MQKALFLSLTIVAVALAGCTDEPQAGEFLATIGAADYSEVGIAITSQSAANEYPGDNAEACGADEITGQLPQDQFYCRDAVSTVALTPEGGATLPLVAESVGYSLFLIDGINEFELGSLDHHGNGHYDFPEQTYEDQDFGTADSVELRFGDIVIATASGTGGAFALESSLNMMSADVAFDGADITVTLADAPINATFTVWLIDIPEEEGEDGEMVQGEPVHAVAFEVSGTEPASYTLTAEEGFVGDYEEFHVHVGSEGQTSINVLKTMIPATFD